MPALCTYIFHSLIPVCGLSKPALLLKATRLTLALCATDDTLQARNGHGSL